MPVFSCGNKIPKTVTSFALVHNVRPLSVCVAASGWGEAGPYGEEYGAKPSISLATKMLKERWSCHKMARQVKVLAAPSLTVWVWSPEDMVGREN